MSVDLIETFCYESLPVRIVFGAGSLGRVAHEAERLGLQRVLVIHSPSQHAPAERVAGLLGDRAVGLYGRVEMHVPVETALQGVEAVKRNEADGCIAVGGGSAIGLAKAIALRTGLPILAVPTTYSGSEMTPIWGLTEGGSKRTGRDLRVLPKTVVYDPELTATLPATISGPSGINALAHCVEALYSENTNPLIALMAEEGARLIAVNLPLVVKRPPNSQVRSRMLRGAWLAGASLGSAGVAIHHKICHALGGGFGLPHAETHTIVLPHAVAYNREAAPWAMERIARALGVSDPAAGLYDLAGEIGLKRSLKEIGMRAEHLQMAAENTVRKAFYNPKPPTYEGVLALLEDAYHGRRPAAQ